MKINCPQCNKKSSASIYEKIYPGYKTLWQQKRCDNCGYLWDEWETKSCREIDNEAKKENDRLYKEHMAEIEEINLINEKELKEWKNPFGLIGEN